MVCFGKDVAACIYTGLVLRSTSLPRYCLCAEMLTPCAAALQAEMVAAQEQAAQLQEKLDKNGERQRASSPARERWRSRSRDRKERRKSRSRSVEPPPDCVQKGCINFLSVCLVSATFRLCLHTSGIYQMKPSVDLYATACWNAGLGSESAAGAGSGGTIGTGIGAATETATIRIGGKKETGTGRGTEKGTGIGIGARTGAGIETGSGNVTAGGLIGVVRSTLTTAQWTLTRMTLQGKTHCEPSLASSLSDRMTLPAGRYVCVLS